MNTLHLNSSLLGASTLLAAVALAGCAEDSSPPDPGDPPAEVGTIVEVAAAAGDFTTLVGAVEAAGLVDALSDDGPFTVFAPTDAAFAALPAGTLDALSIEDLTDILLYHVVAEELFAADVIAADALATLLGEDVAVVVDSGNVFIGDAQVTVTDIMASNGVIHVIDAVLLPPMDPPDPQPGTIPEVAAAAGDFDTLVEAVTSAGLADALSGDGPFTVFAPTDAAFAALPAGTLDALSNEDLTDILLYHVIDSAESAANVVDASSYTMLNGDEVEITIDGGDVYVNDAKVTMTDIQASNGVIHVINAVLIPEADVEPGPGTIPEVAAAAGGFDILLDAVAEAGLDDALASAGPFTVFAPTDAAFAALPEGTLDALTIEELTNILSYHVVADELFSGDVADADWLPTLFGPDLPVTLDDGDVFVDGVQITQVDIEASNGVIHVIDAVMLPPGDIPTVATEAGTFTTLLDAVVGAGLADTLSGEGPFTVFAPSDAAFATLPEGTLESLTTEQLTDILLYHVAGERLRSGDVVSADAVPSLLGIDIPVEVTEDGVFVDGAAVSATDIQASNGVIHVIDAVMLPPGDIPTIATEAGTFTTLVGALAATGLDEALAGDGPFTVFAPTDAAFAALPEGTLESLTTEQIADVLRYHVVADALWAGDVVGESLIPSLLGPFIKVDVSDDAATVAGATISVTDIRARNGVIHVIDAVMLPPGDIPTVASDAGVFATLIGALVDTGLADALSGEGPFTVFAPTDAAFAALPEGTLESLTAEQLADILRYHVASGIYTAADVVSSDGIPMLSGDSATPSVMDGSARIDAANIVATDIPASNGVIHVIDAVILPPADE